MLQTVKTFDNVYQNILQFNRELPLYPALAARLKQVHSFYAVRNATGEIRFGFSKYCGYAGVNAETYLAGYQTLNGRNTEHALGIWFDEVAPFTLDYAQLHDQLSDILAQFDKSPRQPVRIFLPKPQWRHYRQSGPSDLVSLLAVVANTLPLDQRQTLAAQILVK